MTALAVTPARLRAMREAVSERGWMPRFVFGQIDQRDAAIAESFVSVGLLDGVRRNHFAEFHATAAGRAWLAKNDKEGGK